MSERTSITAPLKDALEALGCLVLRMPAGGQRGRIRLMPKGTPDLLVLPPKGRTFDPPGRGANFFRVAVVETKASHRDKCKCESCAAQRTAEPEYAHRGALYVRARSVLEGLIGLGFAGAGPA